MHAPVVDKREVVYINAWCRQKKRMGEQLPLISQKPSGKHDTAGV
jgi:hypothetical protein